MVEGNIDFNKGDGIRIDEKEYFVSFIDILGFKNIINGNNQFPNLIKVYFSLLRSIKYFREIHLNEEPNYFYRLYGETPSLLPYADIILNNNFYNFSDSVIFFIEASNDGEDNIIRLNTMCWITNAFIVESIITDPRIFQLALRGAIAFGPAIMDTNNRIHIGAPIVDAFNLSNNLNWMGAALHPSVHKFVIPDICGHDKQIIEYQIPKKSEYKDKLLYALNWVQQHPSEKDLLNGNRRPRINDIGNSHVLKYDWGDQENKKQKTMKFVEFICNLYDTA